MNLLNNSLGLLGRAYGKSIAYLLRDDFRTDEAAPLTSPRTCEPGPGMLTLVQNDGQFSIVDGKLKFLAQATPVWGDLGFYSAALARRVGLAVFGIISRSSGGTGPMIGFGTATDAHYNNYDGAIYFLSSGLNALTGGGAGNPQVGATVIGIEYQVAVALRQAGCLFFVKGGDYSDWTLLWVDSAGTSSTLYPKFINFNAAGTLNNLRVLDLAALDQRFATDYGLATTHIPGDVSVGQTFTHEADFVMEWTQTALPTTGSADVIFSQQDANNKWIARVLSTGEFRLIEVVAGVETQRATTASSTILNGHRIIVVKDGSLIRGYSNNVLRWIYSSATSSATSGTTNANTGGTISNLVTYPRYVTLPEI